MNSPYPCLRLVYAKHSYDDQLTSSMCASVPHIPTPILAKGTTMNMKVVPQQRTGNEDKVPSIPE